MYIAIYHLDELRCLKSYDILSLSETAPEISRYVEGLVSHFEWRHMIGESISKSKYG